MGSSPASDDAAPVRGPGITLERVTRRFGARVAVRELSLSIEAGARIALVGPSGSGKTTLLAMIAGALASSSGRVVLVGEGADSRSIDQMSARALRAHRCRTGFVEQGASLVPQLRVHENVVAGLLPCWPWWRVLLAALLPLERERVHVLLGKVGLADRQFDLTAQLSGGERQRVAVARALAAEHTLLLADEPTAALDPTRGEQTLALLASEARRRGATLIVTSHRVEQVRAHVDRVIGLRDGQLALDAPAAEVDEVALARLYEGERAVA